MAESPDCGASGTGLGPRGSFRCRRGWPCVGVFSGSCGAWSWRRRCLWRVARSAPMSRQPDSRRCSTARISPAGVAARPSTTASFWRCRPTSGRSRSASGLLPIRKTRCSKSAMRPRSPTGTSRTANWSTMASGPMPPPRRTTATSNSSSITGPYRRPIRGSISAAFPRCRSGIRASPTRKTSASRRARAACGTIPPALPARIRSSRPTSRSASGTASGS